MKLLPTWRAAQLAAAPLLAPLSGRSARPVLLFAAEDDALVVRRRPRALPPLPVWTTKTSTSISSPYLHSGSTVTTIDTRWPPPSTTCVRNCWCSIPLFICIASTKTPPPRSLRSSPTCATCRVTSTPLTRSYITPERGRSRARRPSLARLVRVPRLG